MGEGKREGDEGDGRMRKSERDRRKRKESDRRERKERQISVVRRGRWREREKGGGRGGVEEE